MPEEYGDMGLGHVAMAVVSAEASRLDREKGHPGGPRLEAGSR